MSYVLGAKPRQSLLTPRPGAREPSSVAAPSAGWASLPKNNLTSVRAVSSIRHLGAFIASPRREMGSAVTIEETVRFEGMWPTASERLGSKSSRLDADTSQQWASQRAELMETIRVLEQELLGDC
mmetsp:Transcript_19921/g.46356  ORF Transcript_19921/g.46356 Transcript_19921/m.46356 type:complete len:125 (-) Transcript_19921:193-567(-)